MINQDYKIGFNDPETFKFLFSMAQSAHSLVGRGVIFLSMDNITEKDVCSRKRFISFLKENCRYIPLDINKCGHLDAEQIAVLNDIKIVDLYREPAEEYNPRKEFVLMLACPEIPELNLEESIRLIICTRFGPAANQGVIND